VTDKGRVVSLSDYSSNPPWLNGALFLAGSAAILYAGTKLERDTDAIAASTGLGRAIMGLLLLAAATSLSEIATVSTATLAGNPRLAVHNLVGAVVINAVVLAIADFSFGKEPITRAAPDYSLLIQGVGLIALLAVALMGMSLGKQFGFQVPGIESEYTIGAWSLALLAAYLLMLFLTFRGQRNPRWQIVKRRREPNDEAGPPETKESDTGDNPKAPLSRLALSMAGAALVVLVAGYVLGLTGDALAKQTGLGATFVGSTMMALATCLPEVTTTTTAVRHGNYQMAIGNIFGSSAFNMLLLVWVALLAGSGDTLDAMSPATQFAVALGIVLNCIYLWGLLERENRTILRMGWDAAAVIVLALGGYWIIYLLE
jgi:cation:H+ antiporter